MSVSVTPRTLRGTAVVLLLVTVSCRTVPPPETLPAHEVAAISPATGAVSRELLADPGAPSLELGPDEEYVAPWLLPSNPSPLYPDDLVSARLPAQTVVVRVTFGEDGAVLHAGRSPLHDRIVAHQERFESAAIRAICEWQAVPPRIRKFRPGADLDGDGKPDYRILVAERVLKTFFDVSFTFDIVDGVPVVRTK